MYDGLFASIKNGIYGIKYKGNTIISHSTADFQFDFEDLHLEYEMENISDLHFDLKPNAKIKVTIFYYNIVDAIYDVNLMSSIHLNRDIKIGDVTYYKGTSMWKDGSNLKYSNFSKEIYQIPVTFKSKGEMEQFFTKLICINCREVSNHEKY